MSYAGANETNFAELLSEYDSYDEDMHKNWQKRVNSNFNKKIKLS